MNIVDLKEERRNSAVNKGKSEPKWTWVSVIKGKKSGEDGNFHAYFVHTCPQFPITYYTIIAGYSGNPPAGKSMSVDGGDDGDYMKTLV